jgi:hypothetical protein
MAPDHVVVADAYVAALVAKRLGVTTYVEQIMFNTPAGVDHRNDLARALAMKEIVAPLGDDQFQILVETRAGLAYLSPDPEEAKGQLALSTSYQAQVSPDIVLVVTHCEAVHAADPGDILESVAIVKRVLVESLRGAPDFARDPAVQKRKTELLAEAKVFLRALAGIAQSLGRHPEDWGPEVLAAAVHRGLYDAPQLIGDRCPALARVNARIVGGACVVVDGDGRLVKEQARIKALGISLGPALAADCGVSTRAPPTQENVIRGPTPISGGDH